MQQPQVAQTWRSVPDLLAEQHAAYTHRDEQLRMLLVAEAARQQQLGGLQLLAIEDTSPTP